MSDYMRENAWLAIRNWSPGHTEPQPGADDFVLPEKDILKLCRDFGMAADAVNREYGLLRTSALHEPARYNAMIAPVEAERLLKEFPQNFSGPLNNGGKIIPRKPSL